MAFLTHKNKEVFDFMLNAQREHPQGMPPSLRDIAKGCGLGSAAAVQYHLKKLVVLGMAVVTEDHARKYRAVDTEEELISLRRAVLNYRPEQIFGKDALHDWAVRAGLQ